MTLVIIVPQVDVVTEELNNKSSLTVRFIIKSIKLRRSLIVSSTGEVVTDFVVLHDFVVEDGEVEDETKTSGVGGGERAIGDLHGLFVGFKSEGLLSVTGGGFGVVTVIVTLHLEVEDLGFAALSSRDEVGVEEGEEIFA